MRKVNLKQPQDVRRLLSRVINNVLSDQIDVGSANCIGQLSNILLKAMTAGELEKRIEDLEKLAFNTQKE